MPTLLRRTPVRLLVFSLLAGLIALPAAAAAQDEGTGGRLGLPDGWAPEGITSLDGSLYAGSLADGAIWQVDPATGEGGILVPGANGAVSVGLDGDADTGRLWVAGGRTGQIHAYDATSGEELGDWVLDAGFLNDVAVAPDAVYVTDSFLPQLVILPTPEGGSLDEVEVVALPITGDLEYGEGFNLNGIVATEAGLVVIHSPTGALYALDPETGVTTLIDTGDAQLSAGDGLELSASPTGDSLILYVVRNQLNEVAALDLEPDLSAATFVASTTSDDLDIPTTSALVGNDLWLVNARFGTPVTPDTEYWISRLDAAWWTLSMPEESDS